MLFYAGKEGQDATATSKFASSSTDADDDGDQILHAGDHFDRALSRELQHERD
jgi:hypothetical protein